MCALQLFLGSEIRKSLVGRRKGTPDQQKQRTLNFADIEGWNIAETEGWKVANNNLNRV